MGENNTANQYQDLASRAVRSANQIEDYVPQVNDQVKGFLSKISRITPTDIKKREDCKFCLHPFKIEAEELWEKTKGKGVQGTLSAVVRFFERKKDQNPEMDLPTMTYQNVQRHIKRHYEKTERKVRMREYGEHITDVINSKVSNDNTIDMLLVIMQEQLVDVGSDENMGVTKKTELLAKVSTTIVDLIKYQDNLRSDLNIAAVMKDKFINMWISFITMQQDKEIKKVLVEQLDTLKNELEDI